MTPTTTSTPFPLVVGLLAVGVLAVLGVATARRAYHRTVARARVAARTGTIMGRVVATATVITLTQWAVLTATTNLWAWAIALGVPALLAGSAVHPLFTVTTITHTRLAGRAGDRR